MKRILQNDHPIHAQGHPARLADPVHLCLHRRSDHSGRGSGMEGGAVSEPADGYEVFQDPSYYDLWAAREIGVRSFYETAHFMKLEDAVAWTHDPDNPETLAKEFGNQ